MRNRTKKKRVLKNWVKNTICIIIIGLLVALFEKGLSNYSDYLEKCDIQKGYTCNIFGK